MAEQKKTRRKPPARPTTAKPAASTKVKAAGKPNRRTRDKPPVRRKRPKTNIFQRYHRGRWILAERAKPKPLSFKQIGDRFGISERQAAEIHVDALTWPSNVIDPAREIDRIVDDLDALIAEAAATIDETAKGSPAKVSAIRLASDLVLTRTAVLQAAGRLPRNLAAPGERQQMQMMLRKVAEVLDSHGVPEEALRELQALAEGERSGQTVIALTPPAAA